MYRCIQFLFAAIAFHHQRSSKKHIESFHAPSLADVLCAAELYGFSRIISSYLRRNVRVTKPNEAWHQDFLQLSLLTLKRAFFQSQNSNKSQKDFIYRTNDFMCFQSTLISTQYANKHSLFTILNVPSDRNRQCYLRTCER